VTKSRRDATRDPGGQFVYLRDVRSTRLVGDVSSDRGGARRMASSRAAARPSAGTTATWRRSSTSPSRSNDVEVAA
jgi:hypothetical protein